MGGGGCPQSAKPTGGTGEDATSRSRPSTGGERLRINHVGGARARCLTRPPGWPSVTFVPTRPPRDAASDPSPPRPAGAQSLLDAVEAFGEHLELERNLS